MFSGQLPSRLATIAKVAVTREEALPIPGGTETFLEWEASDGAGLTETILAHHTRTDTEVSYTACTNIVSHLMNASGEISSSTKNITVSAIKGEISGSVRRDHVTMTIIDSDGRSHRQTLDVPVRLEIPELQGLATADVISRVGNIVLQPK